MSQHPSLRVDSVGIKHRNVLKRLERIKRMTEEAKWKEDSSVYGLPKLKSIKIKVTKKGSGDKDKEAAEGEAPAAGVAAPAGTPTPKKK